MKEVDPLKLSSIVCYYMLFMVHGRAGKYGWNRYHNIYKDIFWYQCICYELVSTLMHHMRPNWIRSFVLIIHSLNNFPITKGNHGYHDMILQKVVKPNFMSI